MADDAAIPMGNLMQGRRGLVMGVANHNSIAWGIARQLAAQGAELAFTYQGEALERRVRPLAESVNATIVLPADVTDAASLDRAFGDVQERWGRLDFYVHAIAFANRDELKGRFIDVSREGFLRALEISAFSFVDCGKRAAALMGAGGAMITLTYLGAERVVPNYNVMGVAKAALEASTRYMARDLGKDGVRVNAISAGPIRTLAMAGISGGRDMLSWNRRASLSRADTTIEQCGKAALYLLSDLGEGVTGEVLHVDGGFHAVAIPDLGEEAS
ncbi:MAG TPA: NADH-specific enoyl-ACP reductase [Hyphomonadaceae bacterium]|nr:NADH-specific enoyl-ACP reductase [Hyphomonadaceae bacterium]